MHINRLDKHLHKTLNLFEVHVNSVVLFFYTQSNCSNWFVWRIFVRMCVFSFRCCYYFSFALLLHHSLTFISFSFEKRLKFVVGHFFANCPRLAQCERIFQRISGLCICASVLFIISCRSSACAFCAVYKIHFWLAIIGKCIAAERFSYINEMYKLCVE